MRIKGKKWIPVASLTLMVPLIAVSAINYSRMEANSYSASAQTLIERSEQVRAQAKPEYEDETLGALPPNELIGPFYRLDDQVSDATALKEPTRPEDIDILDNVFSYEFDEESGLRAANKLSTLERQDGALVIQHDVNDYLTNEQPIEIPKDEVGEILIRAKAKKGKHIRLAWSKKDDFKKNWTLWTDRLDIPIVPDNKFHTYFINAANVLKRGLKTGDMIRRIALSPSDIDGDRIEIDFIRFLSKHSKYIRRPRGVTYETVANQMRQVLYMLPDQKLEYTLTIPKKFPKLDFGTAVLVDDEPVQFMVNISDEKETIILHNRSIASTSQWHDFNLDLGLWAGKSVRLSITVQGSTQNVALWSNPIVYSEPEKPFNVIILLEDTLRADHLSTHGYSLPTTPTKEKLSKNGMVFLNAVSQATKTRPSVASMMTSLLPSTTGVWHWADILHDAYLTLPEIMRSQGFATASFIQNGNAGPWAGLHQGFSTLIDQETVKGETEKLFGDHLLAWLERHRHRNFFLYLHVMDPHGEYDPPPPYDAWYQEIAPGQTPEKFEQRMDPKWVSQPTVEGRRSLYDGEILHNDAVLSTFIQTLQDLGLYQHTLFILTSDHGEYLGEHGLWQHHPPGYSQVTHVQLMLLYPERYSHGQKIPERVQLLDVMPTVLDLAMIEKGNLLFQGDSLLDLIEGGGQTDWKNRTVVSEEPTDMDKGRSWHNRGLFVRGSLFYRNWHMITSPKFWGHFGQYVPELAKFKVFNVATDPEEDRPIIWFFPDLYFRYQHASILTQLQTNNIEAWKTWTSFGQDQTYRFDPDVLEHLKALGYVE